MENQNSKKVLIGAIVLAVVALLAGWWLLNNDGAKGPAAVGTVGQTATSTKSNAGARLTVNDQFPGQIIFISDVTLPNGGWVVIRKDDAGAVGDLVAAGYFAPDIHVGEVDLATATREGERYYAVLYDDNGDGRFSLGGDKPILGADGQVLQVIFSVTRDLPEQKG
jgi:hypothetical protein